jgi:hypothetical protein
VEEDITHCPCGGCLKVQKTQTRDVTLLDFGNLTFNEKVKYCPDCYRVFGSQKLRMLVPEYSNFGYDVIEFIGRKLFTDHLTESDVLQALKERNVEISPSEIAFLGKKFILYLAQAHKDKESAIKGLIQRNGGYIIHLDGTCDGASPHFFCAFEELLKLVLLSRKIPSEAADAIVPILEELKACYGTPLGIVCDMSKAILAAIKRVFPGVPVFICHFHYLRDLGKDLLKNDYDLLVSTMRDYDVKTTLSKLARDLRVLVRNYSSLSQYLEPCIDNIFSQKLPEEVLAHLLVEWIQDYSKDSAGYGYPFDRSHLAQVTRMEEAYEYLKKLTLKPEDRLTRIKDFLEEVLTPDFQECIRKVKKKAEHFDELRAIMRIAPPEGKDGLNDDGGGEVDQPAMKKELESFVDREEIKNAVTRDLGYRKMLAQIAKYKDRLFTNGIEVMGVNEERKYIQPERTNNCCERLFRDEKRGVRKRTGYKSMSQVFKTMIAETPYVKNLENHEYLQVILNDKSTLAERFAEIDGREVRKAMQRHYEDQDKLQPRVKKILETDNLLQNIVESYVSLMPLGGMRQINKKVSDSPSGIPSNLESIQVDLLQGNEITLAFIDSQDQKDLDVQEVTPQPLGQERMIG